MEKKRRKIAGRLAGSKAEDRKAAVQNICVPYIESKEHKVEDMELIRKTFELSEIRGKLEDQFNELEKLNKEIVRQNKELIRKTLELTETRAQLEDKNDELEQANKEILNMLKIKTEFINQAAHDLRTPLTPILTLLPLLGNTITDKDALHNLEVIERNANYLNHIVNELIGLIKLQTSKLEGVFEEIDIGAVANEVIGNNEVIFSNHKLGIIKKFEKKLPTTLIDRFKMIEVFQNLLGNSVKYTPDGGTITITIKKIDNFINVRISDNGIGMSKKTLAKLFTEFFRADQARHTEGAGLGLSICKRIIEKHEGRVWAESKGLGKGSSMIFEIPIKQK